MNSRRKTNRRVWTLRLLAIAAALIVALPLGELAIRIALTVNYRGQVKNLPTETLNDSTKEASVFQMILADPDPRLNYRLRPNMLTRYQGAEVRTNNLGFRCDPSSMTLAKPPNTLRVFGLGDSTMFGLGVKQDQTYMSLLGQEFQDLLHGKFDVQFVNTGAMGYNPVQELAMLEKTGLAMQPEAVIIQWDRNDLMQPIGYVRPDFLRARTIFLFHPFELLRGTYSDIQAFYVLDQQDRLFSPGKYGGWEAVEEAYRRMAEVCRKHGIALFAVQIFEDLPHVEPGTPLEPSHEKILGIWKQLGITTIETLPAAKNYLAENNKNWIGVINRVGDPHPNAIGHAIIAETLLPPLREVLLKKAGVKFEDLPTSATFGIRTRAQILDKRYPGGDLIRM